MSGEEPVEPESVFVIELEIPDFLTVDTRPGEWCESPPLNFGETTWRLRVYPNGEEGNSGEGYVGIYVMREDLGPPVTPRVSVYLKTKDGKEEVGDDKVLTRSEIVERADEFLPTGSLRILCTLHFDEQQEVQGSESEQLASAENVDVDYKLLLISGDSCDVTFLVEGQKFRAHRALLEARSPVFASMFSEDTSEKKKMIDLEGCDLEHFPDFLDFLYSQYVELITSQNVFSLYRAAYKFEVQYLRSVCLQFMGSHMDADNFCDVLALALLHEEEGLLMQVTDFFVENSPDITKTAKWQEFLLKNPVEGNKLLIKRSVFNGS